jgi:ATP-binding cassette subfamily B protein
MAYKEGMPAAPRPTVPRSSRTDALWRIIQVARPERKLLAGATVFLLIGTASNMVLPQGIRLIVDGALREGNTSRLDRLVLMALGLFLVQGAAMGARLTLFTIAGERTVARVRKNLFRNLVEQEVAFFDAHRTGELTSRLASDTATLQSSVSANLSMGLRHLASIVLGVALLLYTSPLLTGLMLLIVPPVALGAVAVARRIRALARQVQDSLAEAGEAAEETLSGIRTVRSFAAEPAEVARYGRAIDHSFELARQRARIAGSFMGLAAFAAYSAAAVVLWYGGRMVIAGQLSAGSLASFLMYSLLVAFAIGAWGDLWSEFMRAAGAAERVFELSDRAAAMPVEGGLELPSVHGDVELRGVTFAYPARADVVVIKDMNLHIHPGEVVALVGSSGSGKSTIASLIGRLYDPGTGALLLDGQDLRTLNPSWLRRHIGVVAQEPILFSGTIRDNIRYARPGASDEDVERAARTANAHDFVSRFPDGYTTLVGERGVQLSGGQKQRVAIARAVLKDPRVLILDEATSALDAESEHLVQEALERLMEGRTTLIIAHRLSTVLRADRVFVIERGQIVQAGSHDALMSTDGLYKRLVERQFVAA